MISFSFRGVLHTTTSHMHASARASGADVDCAAASGSAKKSVKTVIHACRARLMARRASYALNAAPHREREVLHFLAVLKHAASSVASSIAIATLCTSSVYMVDDEMHHQGTQCGHDNAIKAG